MNCLSLEGTGSEFWREEKMAGGRWRGTDRLDWCRETIWANSEHTHTQSGKQNRIHTDKRQHTPQPHTEAHPCASTNRSMYASYAKHAYATSTTHSHTHIFVRLYTSLNQNLTFCNDLIINANYKTCQSDTLLHYLLIQQSFPARFLYQSVRLLLFINDLLVPKRYCIVTLLPRVLYSWDYTCTCSTILWD